MKNSMFKKYLALASLMAACAFSAHAQSAPPAASAPKAADPAKFDEHKQRELARIEKHLSGLQTLQSCVKAANDHAALKACNQAARAAMPHHDKMHDKMHGKAHEKEHDMAHEKASAK
jgi:hypothetical protein